MSEVNDNDFESWKKVNDHLAMASRVSCEHNNSVTFTGADAICEGCGQRVFFISSEQVQMGNDTIRTENEQLKKAVKDMDEALIRSLPILSAMQDNLYGENLLVKPLVGAVLSRNSDIIKKAGGEYNE